MTFEDALKIQLSTITQINNKVFFVNAPKGQSSPYMVCLSSEGLDLKSLEGFLNLKELSLEINILEKTFTSVKSLSKTVVNKLKSLMHQDIGGYYIQDVDFESDMPTLYEDEIGLYRTIINVNLSF